jgi:hypothetical protein
MSHDVKQPQEVLGNGRMHLAGATQLGCCGTDESCMQVPVLFESIYRHIGGVNLQVATYMHANYLQVATYMHANSCGNTADLPALLKAGSVDSTPDECCWHQPHSAAAPQSHRRLQRVCWCLQRQQRRGHKLNVWTKMVA